MRTSFKVSSVVALVMVTACGGGAAESPVASGPAASTASASASADPVPTAAPSASASAEPAAPAAPAPGKPLTIAAMKITGPKDAHPIEVKADGKVLLDGKPVWAFVGSELRDGATPMFAVFADDSVTSPLFSPKEHVKFTDKDELVSDDGSQIAVGDDGVVKLVGKGGAADKLSGAFKVTKLTPAARRAATLAAFMAVVSVQLDRAKAELKKDLKKKSAKP